MPYRNRNRKPRKPKRKRYYNNRSMLGQALASPIGRSFKTMVRYVDKNIQLNPGLAGVPANYVFSLNGLYDPDITSTGHQPLGFDQFMDMYDHYTVIGARARVTFSNTDASYHQLVALQLKDTNTVSTTTNEILENGNNKWATLGTHTSGQSVKELVVNCSISKFFGRKVMAGDKYSGTISSNPNDQVFLHLHAGPLEATDADIVDATVDIEYIVVFTEPKQLAQS